MNHPAHLNTDRIGLPLVDKFVSFDITDAPDPETVAKIAEIHQRRYDHARHRRPGLRSRRVHRQCRTRRTRKLTTMATHLGGRDLQPGTTPAGTGRASPTVSAGELVKVATIGLAPVFRLLEILLYVSAFLVFRLLVDQL